MYVRYTGVMSTCSVQSTGTWWGLDGPASRTLVGTKSNGREINGAMPRVLVGLNDRGYRVQRYWMLSMVATIGVMESMVKLNR